VLQKQDGETSVKGAHQIGGGIATPGEPGARCFGRNKELLKWAGRTRVNPEGATSWSTMKKSQREGPVSAKKGLMGSVCRTIEGEHKPGLTEKTSNTKDCGNKGVRRNKREGKALAGSDAMVE